MDSSEFNDIACRQLGYSREEFAKLYVNDYEVIEKPEETKAHIEKVLREGKEDFETKHRTKTGETRNVFVTVKRVELNNKQVFYCIFRDITKFKKAEEKLKKIMFELERSNVELERFAYIASHDLQEPLRTVTSYVQLLERRYKDKLDADAGEFIAYAVDGATRMQRLISDLLIYSRVGTKGKDFEPTGCEIVLKQALANLKKPIEETGAVITHDPLPIVMGDNTQLLQLFQNLIGNAIKFRDDASPKIHISAKKIENTEQLELQHQKDKMLEKGWLFSVQDNGIRIEPQYAERIFAVFQRLHSRSKYPGTGIGLAICKKIVERHGGRIWWSRK